VVWPESSCNFYLFREWKPTSKVIELSQECPLPIVVGGAAYEDGKYFNREWLLISGNPYGYYDKVHLVPFGEYLPLSSLLQPFLGKMVQEVSDFSKGERLSPIGDMGVLICFESIFPDISRTLSKKGATYLVNTSNDAWFKTWATPEQDLQISGFRAIENRRWLIRSVNHGISAFIDPLGRITSSLGLLKEGVILEDIKKNSYLTFYTRYGAALAWIWGIVGMCLIVSVRRKK
jgi:apolipoprotein N-acyltransferase